MTEKRWQKRVMASKNFLSSAVLGLCFVFSALALASAAVPMSLTLRSDKGNADHGSIMFGYSWRTPAPYNETASVPCESAASETISHCRVTLALSGITSTDATAVLARVKAKVFANASNRGPAGYCQLAIAGTSEQALANNYFVHVEVQGGDTDGTAQRRQVGYTEIIIPVDSPTLDITKEIVGECEVELAVYFEGQIVQRSMLAQLGRNLLGSLPTSVKEALYRL